jgi:hypothetical protein
VNRLTALPRLAAVRLPLRWRLSYQLYIGPRLTMRLPVATAEVVRWPTSAKASHIC